MTHGGAEEGWTVFGLDLPARVLSAIRGDAEARYPREACGLVFGRPGVASTDWVVPLQNVARTPGAFAFDDREHLELLERADEEGRVERVLYHSHPDAGAYLSAVDRAALAPGGRALMPDLVHVVVEVRRGRALELAAFRFNADTGGFDEAHPPPDGLPDLELRAGASTHPLPAVGGMLCGRRLGPGESRRLRPLAEGRSLSVNAGQAALIRCFERGILSPLTGFQTLGDVRTVTALGRTPRGVPWRSPVTLQVPRAPEWSSGQVIELIGPGTTPLALMVVGERWAVRGGVMIGGPLFVYPTSEPDARDLRADWITLGAERVLALPSEVELQDLDLKEFDALLVGSRWFQDVRASCPVVRSLAERTGDLWLTAAMAQNQGATHIALPPGPVRREVRDTLALTVECPLPGGGAPGGGA